MTDPAQQVFHTVMFQGWALQFVLLKLPVLTGKCQYRQETDSKYVDYAESQCLLSFQQRDSFVSFHLAWSY